MTQNLPIGEFSFLTKEEIEHYSNNINQLFEFDENYGFIIEADLKYPESLFDKHIDLPFAPEHINNKLIPNFYDKKNYKMHYKSLEMFLKNVYKT